MLAVELFNLDCWTVTYNINAYIVTYFDNNQPTWYHVDEFVPLETCTAEDFKLMPQLWGQADALEMEIGFVYPSIEWEVMHFSVPYIKDSKSG